MKTMYFLAALAVASASAGVSAETTEQVFGHWQASVNTDAFTGELVCRANHDSDPDRVFLDPSSFAIFNGAGRGGVEGWQIRIDEEPALPRHNAETLNIRTSVVGFRQGEAMFQRIMGAQRVRVRIFGLRGETNDYDLEMSGAQDAVAFLASQGCK